MSEVRTFHGEQAYRISLFRNIAIFEIASTLDEAGMLKIEQAVLRLHQDLETQISVLTILRGSAPIPGAGARAYASHLVKAHGDWIALIAVVVEDSTIVMQLFRSLVRSINFIAGRSRIHVFPHLMAAEEALAEQLSPQGGGATRLSEFRAAVREARANFAANSPGSAA